MLPTRPKRFIPAGYKPIVQETPYEHKSVDSTPIEPSPEHKIVVELAGQWSSNAARVMLGKVGEQPQKLSTPKADKDNSHRSIATFKGLDPEAQTLYLSVPLVNNQTPLKLLLAENVQPVDKEEDMAEWDNVLVPIMPVLNKGESGTELYSHGYLYVIWNNKVWRELKIEKNGYFRDIDIDYHRNNTPSASKKTRHINVDGGALVPGYFMGDEPFIVKQAGVQVFEGKLAIDETSRVFGFTEEKVEISFPNVEVEPIEMNTQASPFKAPKASEVSERGPEGFPLPHILVPYKIMGEVQSECYVYYSEEILTLTQLSELESDPASIATPLAELSSYSNSQSFAEAGEFIGELTEVPEGSAGAALINSQLQSNVARVCMGSSGKKITIKYLFETGTDQQDDFFMLRSKEPNWSARSYFRSATKDEDDYLFLDFISPPEEVTEVDILRGSSCDHGRGVQQFILVEPKVPVSELLG